MEYAKIYDLVPFDTLSPNMWLAADYVDSGGVVTTGRIRLQDAVSSMESAPPQEMIMFYAGGVEPPYPYLALNGQNFDTEANPRLAQVYPSGVLPDWRGRVLKMASAGQTVGSFEADQNKSHNHTISVNNTDLGTKTAASNGAHTHTVSGSAASNGAHTHFVQGDGGGGTTTGLQGTSGGGVLYGKTSTSAGAHTHTVSGSAASNGAHTHNVAMGSHNHSASSASNGGTEVRVKSVLGIFCIRGG